jgi:hypothetical protein
MRDYILGVAALTGFGFLVLWMVSLSPYSPASSIDAEAPAPVSQPVAVAPAPSPPAAPAPVSAEIPAVSTQSPAAPPVAIAPAPSFAGAPRVAAPEFDSLPAPAFVTRPAPGKARRQASAGAPAPRTVVKAEKSKMSRAPSKPVIARPIPKPAPARAGSREKKAVHR